MEEFFREMTRNEQAQAQQAKDLGREYQGSEIFQHAQEVQESVRRISPEERSQRLREVVQATRDGVIADEERKKSRKRKRRRRKRGNQRAEMVNAPVQVAQTKTSINPVKEDKWI